MAKAEDFKHVTYAWDDQKAAGMGPLQRLVYRSNLLGGDQRVTNTAGGNTSSIITETDPLTGEAVEVFWVKGSGGDLRTADESNFASLRQAGLMGLQPVYLKKPLRGAKSGADDAMVGLYLHTNFNLNPRAPSIDTPLLSFVPHRHVDHLHPNACIALAASADGERLTREIYGGEVGWMPFVRPGFDLGLQTREE